MIEERKISLFTKGEKAMCLLYLLLFGCACNNCSRSCGCGCASARSGCGCSASCSDCDGVSARTRNGCCGCENNCGNSRGNGCGNGCGCSCTCSRSCSGFGRHGSASVCCDAEYYNRQYALCCQCQCNACCKNN